MQDSKDKSDGRPRVRYLAARTPDGRTLFLGSPGVTYNAGRNERKKKLRVLKKLQKRWRREEKRRNAE